jgi:hypothetical protein
VIWANSAVVLLRVAPVSPFVDKIPLICFFVNSVWAIAIFNASVEYSLEAEVNAGPKFVYEIVLSFIILLILLKAFKDSPLVLNCVVKVVIV